MYERTPPWYDIIVLADRIKPLPVADAGLKTVCCFGWGQGHQ